jgi:hypothetical protein
MTTEYVSVKIKDLQLMEKLESTRREKRKAKTQNPSPLLDMAKRLRPTELEILSADQSLEYRIKLGQLATMQLVLTDAAYRAESGLMDEYHGGKGMYNMSPSEAVTHLTQYFRGFTTADEIEKRAMDAYTGEKDEKIDQCRSTLVAWWKKVHRVHQIYDDQIPGAIPGAEEVPGKGRMIVHYKLMIALDVANWVKGMNMNFEKWVESGKAELYDWMETQLLGMKALDVAYVF